MERLELAISGAERALRPATRATSVPAQGWLSAVGQQLPRVMEALGAEHTVAGDHSLAARAARLTTERNRLLRQLQALAPAFSDGSLSPAGDAEQLRRALLRLLHDIAHHHQRVNDLVYDAGWRDVGGSE